MLSGEGWAIRLFGRRGMNVGEDSERYTRTYVGTQFIQCRPSLSPRPHSPPLSPSSPGAPSCRWSLVFRCSLCPSSPHPPPPYHHFPVRLNVLLPLIAQDPEPLCVPLL